MHLSKLIGICVGIFLLMNACTPPRKDQNNEALRHEMEQRAIKKVSEGEIFSKALEMGKELTDSTQAILKKQLMQAINQQGVPGAISFCSMHATSLDDSLERHYQVSIQRVSNKFRNPGNAPDSLEQSILDAYQYNANEGLALEANVANVGDTTILFTRPITLKSALCLNCHGQEGTEVQEATLTRLDSIYPNDHATGYGLMDFRGMWTVKMPKSTIVNAL